MHITGNFDAALRQLSYAATGYANLSFSQFGEDLLIDVFFHAKVTPGFYVDIGAHHPQRFSNTYLLHQRGWRGINVDGDPESIKLFETERPSDINVAAFLAETERTVIFNKFSDTAVNTISEHAAARYACIWDIVSQSEVRTTTLKSLLDQHFDQASKIDLLSVDVEGVDLQVLQGNDWSKYRPYLVVVEAEGLDLSSSEQHDIVSYLFKQGYRLVGFLHVSAFFLREAS